MIDTSKFIITPDGKSRRLKPSPCNNSLTQAEGGRIIYSMPAEHQPLIGSFAIWECNHCTERRVYGNVAPDLDSRTAFIVCQQTKRHELHTFREISGEWEGKPCPLPLLPRWLVCQ